MIEKGNRGLDGKKSQLFFNGDFYDAYSFVQSLFEKANSEIIIIDNYIDRSILDRLVVKKDNVKVIIFTNKEKSLLLNSDIKNNNKQYSNLKIYDTKIVHDRYIIIDRCKIYHLGYSIKDLGKKIFSISESDNSIIDEL